MLSRTTYGFTSRRRDIASSISYRNRRPSPVAAYRCTAASTRSACRHVSPEGQALPAMTRQPCRLSPAPRARCDVGADGRALDPGSCGRLLEHFRFPRRGLARSYRGREHRTEHRVVRRLAAGLGVVKVGLSGGGAGAARHEFGLRHLWGNVKPTVEAAWLSPRPATPRPPPARATGRGWPDRASDRP
jgi:hypothetical protein